ncbi:MAG: chromate transporter [Rubrivivax sp.]|nr:chromate transporter [Rubrivivax sp.]
MAAEGTPLSAADWLGLGAHLLVLSLLAVGGAIAVAPDMHRYIVVQQGWLSDPQFAASIALAQAAPGPNVLFVALLGFNVGWHGGGALPALLGLAIAMGAMLLPSSLLTLAITRWLHRHREDRAVRAFKQGMAPVVIGLLLATAWILVGSQRGLHGLAPLATLSVAVALLFWRTRLHLLWMLGAGALLGASGLV